MITLATAEDLPQVTDMARRFYTALNFGLPFAADTFVSSWTQFLQSGHGLIMKRTVSDKVHEAISVLIYVDPHSGQRTAANGFWYVNGEDDSSLASGLLHQQLERELQARNVKRVYLANLCNGRHVKVDKFLQRAGYYQTEIIYRKELS